MSDRFLELPAEDYPTAREQIERIQRAVRQGEYKKEFSGKYLERRKNAVALTLAARELLGVRRGGDGLDRRLTPEVYIRAKEIQKVLDPMSSKDFGKLYDKLTSGHGGTMVEQYQKMNSYRHFIDNQKNFLKQGGSLAEAAANMMAAASVAREDPMRLRGPIDIKRVDSVAKRLMQEDTMQELLKNENARKLIRDGNVIELTQRFIEKRKELTAQKQAAAQAQPEPQHEKEGQNNPPEMKNGEAQNQGQINREQNSGLQAGFQG